MSSYMMSIESFTTDTLMELFSALEGEVEEGVAGAYQRQQSVRALIIRRLLEKGIVDVEPYVGLLEGIRGK